MRYRENEKTQHSLNKENRNERDAISEEITKL